MKEQTEKQKAWMELRKQTPNEPKTRRNALITIAVLRGVTYFAAGTVFGITGDRVRQIVHQVVRKAGPYTGQEELRLWYIKDLRAQKNRIIPRIKAKFLSGS